RPCPQDRAGAQQGGAGKKKKKKRDSKRGSTRRPGGCQETMFTLLALSCTDPAYCPPESYQITGYHTTPAMSDPYR
ncbi:MAG: hypothetical protein ACPIOQ_80365, partial [Promethearchaeia archaeon]